LRFRLTHAERAVIAGSVAVVSDVVEVRVDDVPRPNDPIAGVGLALWPGIRPARELAAAVLATKQDDPPHGFRPDVVVSDTGRDALTHCLNPRLTDGSADA